MEGVQVFILVNAYIDNANIIQTRFLNKRWSCSWLDAEASQVYSLYSLHTKKSSLFGHDLGYQGMIS